MNNYFVNLFVTDQCNFKCRYCYEKNEKKNKESMDQKTADNVINFIKSTIKPWQQLTVTFHGGEPLIRFSLITYIIDRLRNELQNELTFGITTNGSLLNEEIVEYLAENMQYKLSISIDGNEKTQNFNRPSSDNSVNYDDIIKYALIMKEKNPLFTIRMTYDRYNVNDLFENIKFFIDNGFDRIIAEADFMSLEWEQDDFDIIYEQFIKVNKYISSIQDRRITVYPVNSENICLNKCTAGHDYYTISTKGKIYPCTMVINNDEFCIGDVTTGINKSELKKIDSITSKETEGCSECSYKKFCTTYRCCFINYASTGDAYSANLVMCNMMNIKKRLDDFCNVKVAYHSFEENMSYITNKD